MSAATHLIEIERLVLVGVDPRNPGAMSALVAAEVQRHIAAAMPRNAEGLADVGYVAQEIAGGVTQSVQGARSDG
jgi:hypothetical protein